MKRICVFSIIMFVSIWSIAQPFWSAYGGVPHAATRASVIDANGNKWVVMYGGGISKFKLDETWDNFVTSNSSIPDNYAISVALDNSGQKWIGTNTSGAVVYNGTTWTTYNSSNSALPGNQVNCITVDVNNNKWFGINLNGVSMFNGTTFTNYNTSNSSLPNNNVNCITIDASGNKWIGTYGGLAKFNGTTWTVYTTANSSIAHDQVYSVTIENATTIWVGTAGGLCKFNGSSTWTTYNTGNSGLPYNYVNCVAIDQNNNKWIGTTQGGMAKFDGNSSWTVFNTSNSDIPGLNVRHIVVDNNNNLWLCSNGGFAFYGTIPSISTDATLSALNVNGTGVSGFSPTTYSYNVVLPYGSPLPDVTSTTNHPNATQIITNTTSLPGAATVVVTAQDGTTILTYTINFTVASPSTDATLSALNVNGSLVSGFNTNTYLYNVEYPYGTTALPTVTATTNFAGATKVITNITAYPGTSTVIVTAQDGTTSLTYSIYFSIALPSTDATLAALLVNGSLVSGFNSDTYSYNIVYPYGTTALPTVTATTNFASATKVITNITAYPGTATVVVTAQDGTTSLTYSINFSIAPNTDASLSGLYFDDTLIPGFIPSVYNYNVTLPFGTTALPNVTANVTDPNASTVITNITGFPGTATVVATAEDGSTTLTYSIYFSIAAANTDATLSALYLNEILVSGFSALTFTYNVEYPFGTTSLPIVTATTTFSGSSFVINNITSYPGTVTVVVTAQDGTTSLIYSINFSIAPPNTDASLSALYINGNLLPGFETTTYTYNIEYPYGTTTLPIVTATTNFPGASSIITNITEFPGTANVIVTAQDSTTSLTYSINFTIAPPSNDATLSALNIDGALVIGFSPNTFTYDTILPAGTTSLPEVTAIANHPNATTEITNISAYPGTATALVTAEDGVTTSTYNINFSIATLIEDLFYEMFSIFPNPSNGEFTVQCESASNLIISDINGKIVFNKKSSENSVNINLKDISTGMYFIQIFSAKYSKTEKLFIQK